MNSTKIDRWKLCQFGKRKRAQPENGLFATVVESRLYQTQISLAPCVASRTMWQLSRGREKLLEDSRHRNYQDSGFHVVIISYHVKIGQRMTWTHMKVFQHHASGGSQGHSQYRRFQVANNITCSITSVRVYEPGKHMLTLHPNILLTDDCYCRLTSV